MATILKRKPGETGNPIEGLLQYTSGAALAIPVGAVVTLNAWRLDTGVQVITDGTVEVLDAASGHVRYNFADDDLAVSLSGVTLELEFTVMPDNDRPTYVPDTDDDELLLTIVPRHRVAA